MVCEIQDYTMNICLVTPAPAGSRTGNRTTALRWAQLLEELGHKATIAVDYAGEDVDAMVALHAWRSAESIARFHQLYPDRPLIVAITGTDLYRDLERHKDVVLRSFDQADVLIGLHDLVADALPERYREKLAVIHQSAQPSPATVVKRDDRFEVLVVGHLRDEKDPLLTAAAASLLPPDSRIAVVHLGRAHTAEWALRARAEMARNPRYEWLGEVSGPEVGAWLSRARLMVLTSVMEGGANVISEAIVAGLPVLSSRIDGSVGLLGRDYPGYFHTGDSKALADLLERAETDAAFLTALVRQCAEQAPKFTVEQERDQWKRVLKRAVDANLVRAEL
jgi:putative glycosyltransferase (TIGR04348 family)